MKIRIEQEFILDSSANLVQMAIESAKCRDQRYQIIQALVARFPAVAEMDLEDLLQFIAVMPNAESIKRTETSLTLAHLEMTEVKARLDAAKAACRAVSDARLFMTDGSLCNEIEEAIEAATKIGYAGEVRPYPPVLAIGRESASEIKAKLDQATQALARATQACEAVADAWQETGPEWQLPINLSQALTQANEVAYGADKPYRSKCTCGHCTQEELARRGGNPS